MAYTNAWTTSSPLGGDPANADDDFRKLRLDLEERLEDVIDDLSADPVTTLTGVVSKKFHWSIGFDTEANHAVQASTFALVPDAVSVSIIHYAPVLVPVGTTLQSVVVRCYRSSTATTIFNIILARIDDTPTKVEFSTQSPTADDTWQDVTFSSLAHTVLASNSYFLRFQMTANSAAADSVRLLHFYFTYDRTYATQGI